ncbi:hypothetical protein HYW44_05330 [Candidatus Daviesbacteria bacterium]|nr:hypothetical protein [Candidatus Daviesbacteria bacterium]
MESDNLGLNIVFMPSREVSDLAIVQCSQIAQDNEVSFKLDGTYNFPHVTIYQLIIPKKNLEKLIQTLSEIANNTGPELFEFTKYEAHEGFIGACFLPAEPIRNTQKKIVGSVTPLREGRNVIEADSNAAKSFSDLQRGIIREYGFDNLFEFYNPILP